MCEFEPGTFTDYGTYLYLVKETIHFYLFPDKNYHYTIGILLVEGSFLRVVTCRMSRATHVLVKILVISEKPNDEIK